MTDHRFKPAQECTCNHENCAICAGEVLDEICEACDCQHNTNWSSKTTECSDAPMSAEQKMNVEARELDFRDGQWVNLRPQLTVEEMVTLCHEEHRILDAEGFKVVRVDHLRDDPPKLGLTIWRPDVRLHAPTTILDVTIIGDGYDYVAVRQVAREGLEMPTLVTYHAIDSFLTRFAVKHGLKEIEVSEILGSDNMIFVQPSTVPLVVHDKVPEHLSPTASAAE